MPAYDLLIHGPAPSTLIFTAQSDETALTFVRECLQLDYAGEDDPAVLASHVSLVARRNGQTVLDAALTEMLSGEAVAMRCGC